MLIERINKQMINIDELKTKEAKQMCYCIIIYCQCNIIFIGKKEC